MAGWGEVHPRYSSSKVAYQVPHILEEQFLLCTEGGQKVYTPASSGIGHELMAKAVGPRAKWDRQPLTGWPGKGRMRGISANFNLTDTMEVQLSPQSHKPKHSLYPQHLDMPQRRGTGKGS
jgi:hypothetical protein